MSISQEEIHPYLELLEANNISKEELEAFIASNKVWGMIVQFLNNGYLNATNVATADGAGVSNSRKLEACTKMGVIREMVGFPQTVLQILQEIENNENVR